MERPGINKAIVAGFVATLAITALMYAGPMMGMPKMDIAAMLGQMVTQTIPEPGAGPWWLGMLIHFVNGTIIFPLIYAYALYAVLPGSPWVKGTLWGLVLWVMAQALVMPMMGMGFFSANAPQPLMGVIGSFIGHFVYGAILGAIAGPGARRIAEVERERRVA